MGIAHVSGSDVNGSGGGPLPSVTSAVAVSPGELIVCFVFVNYYPTVVSSVVVTDSVNSGNYTMIGNWQSTTNHEGYYGIFFMVCNASGTPTVSCSSFSASYDGSLKLSVFNGFAGTPTIDVNFGVAGGYTGTSSPLANSGNIVTGYANELCLAIANSNGTLAGGNLTNWTEFSGAASCHYSINATSGTNVNYSQTITGSPTWWGLFVGAVYDPGASSTYPLPFTQTAFFSTDRVVAF